MCYGMRDIMEIIAIWSQAKDNMSNATELNWKRVGTAIVRASGS